MARVLVVEDEPITAADLEHKLVTLGHDVTWLDSGEEAVSRASSADHDLVLMDIRLRGAMTGIEAAQQMRVHSDVPIVFLTAFADADTLRRVCETQPHGYVVKPFTDRGVAAAVQVALSRAEAERRDREHERGLAAAIRNASDAPIAVDLQALSSRLGHEINNPLTSNLMALQLALGELEELLAELARVATPAPYARLRRIEQLSAIIELLRDAQAGAMRIAQVVRELQRLGGAEGDFKPLVVADLIEIGIGLSGIESMRSVKLARNIEYVPGVMGDRWQLGVALAYGLRSTIETLRAAGASAIELAIHAGTDARGWAAIRFEASSVSEAEPGPAESAERPRALPAMPAGNPAIVEQIVARHLGELRVAERPFGRNFELQLPPSAATAPGSAPPSQPSSATERKSVLVIDDEPTVGKVLGATLKTHYQVTVLESAESALAALASGATFDAILCDLSMPTLGGREFYERLHAIDPATAERVIFISGGATNTADSWFLERMAGRCVTKPFSSSQLLAALAERMRNEVAANGER